MRRGTLHGLVLAAAAAAGCRAPGDAHAGPRAGDYPGVLREPASLGRDVLWRQHVTATWPAADDGEEPEKRGFDAVVQKVGDTLTVLGLSPAGSVGFSIVLAKGEVELENRMPRELPFDPAFVLLDVQRAFYPWLPGDEGDEGDEWDEGDAPPADGRRAAEVDGEEVTETWSEGRLLERTFRRLDGQPAGTITVTYRWRKGDGLLPSITHLENGWFAYGLEIETLEARVLEAAATGSP